MCVCISGEVYNICINIYFFTCYLLSSKKITDYFQVSIFIKSNRKIPFIKLVYTCQN